MLRPRRWQPAERHILLGVSHASNDPARHRVFEIRASFHGERGEWVAQVGEQNLNEQRGTWQASLSDEGLTEGFATAAACLGHAVETVIAAVDAEAETSPAEAPR